MADSLAVVVESLRLLAGIQESENAGAGARQEEKIETGNGNGKNLERQVRKVRRTQGQRKCSWRWRKSVRCWLRSPRTGSRRIELLGKYGVVKLSAVKQEDYPALLQEAKVL